MQTVNTSLKLSASTNKFVTEAVIEEPETTITFKVLGSKYRTSSYPQTLEILKTHLPGVLKTKCFNESGNGFSEEVLDTEVSHLFEHILLQYLYELKKSECSDPVTFSGWTVWDWSKDPVGTFNIIVDADCSYKTIFEEAFNKSVALTNYILQISIKKLR
jgi:hypothetical protein